MTLTAHHLKQKANLLKIFENQDLCDVTFIVGEERKEIKTHRLLLATISPVFKAMLFGNMRESEPNAEIEIVDINPNAFESVLRFAYCNDPILSPDNIVSIKQICDKYQISLVSELCDQYFNSCISSQNICSLLNQALNVKLALYVNIIQQKLSQIGSEASEIIKSETFFAMNIDAMMIFLQSDTLNIKEEDLWEAVLKWADYQISNNNNDDFDGSEPAKKKQKLNNEASRRKKSKNNHNRNNKNEAESDPKINLLKTICPFIRFGLMNGTYFVKNVKPLNCLSIQDIADIVCFIQCNDEQCGKFSIKPRTYIHSLPPTSEQLYYTLRMSSKYIGPPNNYINLITSDLTQGCGTQKTRTPWIKASFNNVMCIKQIEIAAASKQMTGRWGQHFFNGAFLQYKDKGKWIDVMRFTGNITENVIHQFNVNVVTKELRVFWGSSGERHLGIGCWRIFGVPKQN